MHNPTASDSADDRLNTYREQWRVQELRADGASAEEQGIMNYLGR